MVDARPTGKDVAELAGVSQSTVSRVLSGSGLDLISEQTIQRVRKIASEVGYSPNPFAAPCVVNKPTCWASSCVKLTIPSLLA